MPQLLNLACALLAAALLTCACSTSKQAPDQAAVGLAGEESRGFAPAHGGPAAREALAGGEGASAPLVSGEALVTAESAPDPAALSALLPGVTVLACEHQLGSVYLIRFSRADGGPADPELTLAVIDALRAAPGIRSSEPNAVLKAR